MLYNVNMQRIEIKFLTVREVCKLLNVSKFTVYNLIEKGELKAVRLPGKWLIREDSVYELIRRRKYEPTKKATSNPE